MVGSRVGHGVQGDYEPSHGNNGRKNRNDVVPGGDTRDYGDTRPGARPPGQKIADERSGEPYGDRDKGY